MIDEKRAEEVARALGGGWAPVDVPGVGRIGWKVVLTNWEAEQLLERLAEGEGMERP